MSVKSTIRATCFAAGYPFWLTFFAAKISFLTHVFDARLMCVTVTLQFSLSKLSGAPFSKVPITFRPGKLFCERKIYLKDSNFVDF